MRKIYFTFFTMLVVLSLQAQNIYYVATNGDDNNTGTIDNPWATWQKAFEMAGPGDTVYFRGGVYYPTSTVGPTSAITLIDPEEVFYPGTPYGHSGTKENPICYFNYPGEKPILDCSKVTAPGNYLGGITLSRVHYLHFKGLEVRNVWQKNFSVSVKGISTYLCSNLTFENLSVHDISGRGMGVSSALGYTGVLSDTTRVINCDFYNCADTLEYNPFNMGDGIKGDFEAHSVFILEGSRAWNCSDDGFDLSGPGQKIVTNSWAFNIGVNFASISAPDDGNGFKLGGMRDSVDYPNWIMKNCIAAGNYRYAIHMLDYTPYWRNNARVYNSVFYLNDYGPTSFGNQSKPWHNTEFYNCISYANTSRPIGLFDYEYPHSNNSWIFDPGPSFPWKDNPDFNITDDDFVSLDINELSQPRKADYSLPDVNFFKLTPGSDLIDGGIDVGIPYCNNAPDVGVFEHNDGFPTGIIVHDGSIVSVNETVNFDASESTDDGSITTYSWDFGDNSSASGITTTHAYSSSGNYTIKLTVTDNLGNQSVTSSTVSILGSGPIAHFYKVLTRAEIGDVVPFNAERSVDDVGITSYSWNFGDGGTGTGVAPTHTYNAPGYYTVTLTVYDADNNEDTFTLNHYVRSNAPEASFIASPNNPEVGQIVTVDASGSTDDYGIVRYNWNWGDGSNGSEGESATHSYAASGTYHIILMVYDADGTYDVTSRVVNVSEAIGGNESPVASFTSSPSQIAVSQTVTFNASESSDDGSISSYEWNFGDGNRGTGVTSTHTYSTTGTFSVRLKVTDNEGVFNILSKEIEVAENSSSINNIEDADSDYSIHVFPNPTSGNLQIELNSKYKEICATVYSTMGQIVYQKNFADSQVINIRLNALKNGVYLLKVNIDDEVYLTRIIKV